MDLELLQVETNIKYDEAIDVVPRRYTYIYIEIDDLIGVSGMIVTEKLIMI